VGRLAYVMLFQNVGTVEQKLSVKWTWRADLACRALQDEYDQLRRALGDEKDAKSEECVTATGAGAGDSTQTTAAAAAAAAAVNGDVVELAAETRLLRQHKGRLEARMRVLEEHNEQLESQLKRLRQLLHDSPADQVRSIAAVVIVQKYKICAKTFILVKFRGKIQILSTRRKFATVSHDFFKFAVFVWKLQLLPRLLF